MYPDFEECHHREKLDEAIDHYRASLSLRPAGHPDRSSSLNNLALTLCTRFNQFGDRDDLDDAIELNRAALALHPPGHPDRSMSLNNLANTLSTRFKLFGDRADLDEAAKLNRELYVVSYTPTFSGWFESVIGTIWAVDEIAHHIISAFYGMLFDYTKAAASLNLGCFGLASTSAFVHIAGTEASTPRNPRPNAPLNADVYRCLDRV
ncbi:hypothetical protein BV22DRAFT_1134750 [Leucogyrophana mollusca]|uniref:Uncharacterized protein n=1 Tax=Leucogyrophana mollusca TaxID=85980 RepID=A0ACB8AXX8_9AGAM|nr:hypothetical protein BV22DRAFT_1134750 [Leucogyrophana mollusca]